MSAPAVPVLRVAGLVKSFRRQSGAVVPAVDHVSFSLATGEFLVLLGPSGCGKTTLLRMIAGLEVPDAGVIAMYGDAVFDAENRVNVPTERRKLSMIFQSYALWPHMTAAQNIAYPLKSRRPKPRRTEIQEAVERVLTLTHIPDLADHYPHEMSGGQQQRVALARALVSGSDLVLFDEPLSNVDAQVREELRFELLQMQRDLGFAAIYVTHDQNEAMGLDAPVSGGPVEARAGTLTFIAGGREDDLAAAGDVIGALSSRVHHAGELGTGKVVKLINNIMSTANILVAAEAFAIGEAAGMAPARLFEILSTSGGASAQFLKRFPHALNDDYAPRFSTALATKDLGLATELAHETGIPAPMTATAREMYGLAMSLGHRTEDMVALLKLYRGLS